MNAITRRDIIRSSVMSLGISGAAAIMPTLAVAQEGPTNPSPTPSVRSPHVDLCAWVTDDIARACARRKKGIESREQAIHTASVIRMYAHHLENIGLDSLVMQLGAGTDPTRADLDACADAVYPHMAKHDPTFDRAEIREAISLSADEVSVSRRSLASQGISHQFHVCADFVHAQSINFDPQETTGNNADPYAASTAGKAAEFPTYDISNPPHFVRADFKSGVAGAAAWCESQMRKAACAGLAIPAVNDAVASALGYCLGFMSPAFFCTAAGGGELVAAGATEGVASVLAPFAGAACGIAELSGAAAFAAGGTGAVITGVSIGIGMRQWIGKYCPAG